MQRIGELHEFGQFLRAGAFKDAIRSALAMADAEMLFQAVGAALTAGAAAGGAVKTGQNGADAAKIGLNGSSVV